MAIIYVDNINGSDAQTGASDSPVKTIAKAIEKIQEIKNDTNCITLKKSTQHYVLESFNKIMQIGYNTALIGQEVPAYVDIQTGVVAFNSTCNSYFINCIFQPVNNYNGDKRCLFGVMGSDTTYIKRFYNCLFKKNNAYPTEGFVYGSNSGNPDTKIYYTNCTFLDLPVNINGIQHINYCTYNTSSLAINGIIDGSYNSNNLNEEGLGYTYYNNLEKDYPEYYRYTGLVTLKFSDQNNKTINKLATLIDTPVDLSTVSLYQEGKLFVGYLKPDGTLIKNGEIITESMDLTPYFVDYEELIVEGNNKISVKVKKDVYDILKKVVDKYITGMEE